MAIVTPAQLWENYDRFGASEPTYLKDGDFGFKVYFNGERVANQSARIYARLSLPKNIQRPPVLLFLNEATIGVDEANVEPLTDMGYAVLSVDYASIQSSGHYTRYPRAIVGEVGIESLNNPVQNPKASAWYHWTAAALHSITFLENCEYVDGNNIGIFGIGEGAAITFKTSNLVKLKAGITFFSGNSQEHPSQNNNSSEHLNFLASLDSKAYNKNNFPILINASTNEKNDGLDYLNELYLNLGDAYISILARADKCVSRSQRANIKLWFDYHFGIIERFDIKKPQINLFFSEGSLYAELCCEAESVNFYAASDSKPHLRNWNNASFSKLSSDKYLAKIDVFGANPVLVFASVLTKEGLMLSSPVVAKTPQKEGEVKKSRLLYNPDMGIDVFMRENGGFFDNKGVEIKEGPLGLSGVLGNQVTTFKPGEARFSADPENILKIILYSETSQDVEFKLVLKDSATEEFSCQKRLIGGEWSTITLSKDDFMCINGRPSFEKVVCLSILGNNIIVNSILWV